ncbi:hypothetical protein ACFSM5_02775 [Lacibacterium aquatile]|uniref:DUF1871 family protein n=1 Tax=Lacibacterium aquatile TaxID=1168082 RepID=A0ABW5DPA8_9PROT
MSEVDVLNPDLIRKILMDEWDPVGVRDNPEAQDEYDEYVSTAHRMLTKRGADAEQLFAFLQWVEADQMELPPSSEALGRRWQAVDSLIALTRVLH